LDHLPHDRALQTLNATSAINHISSPKCKATVH